MGALTLYFHFQPTMSLDVHSLEPDVFLIFADCEFTPSGQHYGVGWEDAPSLLRAIQEI
jgi:hypothetical protein